MRVLPVSIGTCFHITQKLREMLLSGGFWAVLSTFVNKDGKQLGITEA